MRYMPGIKLGSGKIVRSAGTDLGKDHFGNGAIAGGIRVIT